MPLPIDPASAIDGDASDVDARLAAWQGRPDPRGPNGGRYDPARWRGPKRFGLRVNRQIVLWLSLPLMLAMPFDRVLYRATDVEPRVMLVGSLGVVGAVFALMGVLVLWRGGTLEVDPAARALRRRGFGLRRTPTEWSVDDIVNVWIAYRGALARIRIEFADAVVWIDATREPGAALAEWLQRVSPSGRNDEYLPDLGVARAS